MFLIACAAGGVEVRYLLAHEHGAAAEPRQRTGGFFKERRGALLLEKRPGLVQDQVLPLLARRGVGHELHQAVHEGQQQDRLQVLRLVEAGELEDGQVVDQAELVLAVDEAGVLPLADVLGDPEGDRCRPAAVFEGRVPEQVIEVPQQRLLAGPVLRVPLRKGLKRLRAHRLVHLPQAGRVLAGHP